MCCTFLTALSAWGALTIIINNPYNWLAQCEHQTNGMVVPQYTGIIRHAKCDWI